MESVKIDKSRSAKYNKWVNPKKHINKAKTKIKAKDAFRKVMGIMLSQLSNTDKQAQVSVSAGLKSHGDKALNALLSEFVQIERHDTF